MTQSTQIPPPPPPFTEIVIIGTGFAGLAMGAQLKRHGHHDFIIVERAGGIGGTWRDNTYPGAACDVPSHLYSFSFRPNPHWSSLFSPGPEILAYLKETAHDEGLLPHISFSTNVEDAIWDQTDKVWKIHTSRGELACRYLITGTGHLADESLPNIPGLEAFKGEVFHSARWPHEAQTRGKRIGIVGSGASALQIVPELAKDAEHLVVFQRTPPYVIPRVDRPYSDVERRVFQRDPSTMREHRNELFWYLESTFASRRAVPRYLAETRHIARAHLERQVPDEALRAKLTPDYTVGCKRVLISNTYYPTFLRDNVQLEASALAKVEHGKAVAASGASHDLDMLIFCTGFETAQPPYAALIRGHDGQPLSQAWAQGMEAFASTTVHGFPNLFMVNGPNTGLGHNSIVYIIEAQVDYILGALDWAKQSGQQVMEVSAHAQAEYVNRMQELAEGTVWLSEGCKSWYVDPRSGRLTLVWPNFAHDFRHRNGRFDPTPYTGSPTVATRQAG
ncbi:flavin-containing monooxygenase [Pseudomonas chlororaphis]|uniref:4-hydroxyacetophenone monooxygenase n=1 Tax=Pseudomonas chlororaphis TaxID=587753 RepID=A0A1Q8EQ51_9PSED|nr:NAD(P)/FAD-dependent oxidoreductase [Pseudomonas chlororaphis]OLF53915.1 4-hydroxyacetophenone monooxygenase [Pseudomonas chlororaphis]